LRQQNVQLGLDRHVVILDSIANIDMPAVYALAKFAVLASQFDQWGLCINEAFATRCPAIVTRTCGAAGELVADAVNGFIVEPGNVQMLADRRLCRDKVACYAVGDKTNNVIDEADHEPSCSARA
jgi:glycosyltransferase involved in cell wall biosynthesis